MAEQKLKREIIGKVTSNKMEKSAVVEVDRKFKHPRYKKYIRRTSKMYVHDEKNECSIGDLVKIAESKPFSKTKTWVLVEILEKSVQEAI